MNKLSPKRIFLIIGGLFFLAASQIAHRYICLNDFFQGISLGVGVGMLIAGLFPTKKRENES